MKILFKFIFVIIFLLVICLYGSYYHTDKILNFLEPSIEKYLPENIQAGLQLEHNQVVGSLADNLEVENFSIESPLYFLLFKDLKVGLKKTSGIIGFLENIFNLLRLGSNSFKLGLIEATSIEYQSKLNNDKLYLKNLALLDSIILSDSLSLNFFDFSLDFKNLKNKSKGEEYLRLKDISNLDFFKFTKNLNIEELIVAKNGLNSSFFEGYNLNLNYEYSFNEEEKIIYISSLYNNIYKNNIKYNFNYNIRLFYLNSQIDSIHIDVFSVLNPEDKMIFTATGGFNVNDYAVNITASTKDVNYYDILTPKNGKFIIEGSNSKYKVNFTLRNVRNMVKETLDKLVGDFILSFNEEDPLVLFPKAINITDKVYNGTAKIKKIMTFEDIFYPDIEIITKSVNPFKINKLNRVD